MNRKTLVGYTAFSFATFEDDMPTQVGQPSGRYDNESETQIPGAGFGGKSTEDTELGSENYFGDMGGTILDVPETGPLAILWMVKGDRRGKVYKIKDGYIIGRRDGDLYLDDPKVSTPHCRFRIEKKKYVLWDCGSKNGTYINNKPVRCATTLVENDLIKIGKSVFVVKLIV
jgi:hypothetical protein